jgi:phage terminase large subunit GpA-like protein
MRIIHPQEHTLLAEIGELKAAVQADWNDPAPKAALEAKRAEHAALRAEHLPAAVAAKRAELTALRAAHLPVADATRRAEVELSTRRRRRELEKEIGWLVEEAARLDIPLAEA